MDIQLKYDLKSHNTFRMKALCECFVDYQSVEELEGLNFEALPKPIIHIGEGSNLLFTKDFPGTILHSSIKHIKYVDMGLDDIPIIVGSGVKFDDFVKETCEYGLWGAENLSFIPGEVGAAAVQNIGAYGVEFKDIVTGVVCFDLQERKKVKFKTSELAYGYRDSMFKHSGGRYVVTSVLLRLSRKPKPRLEYRGLASIFGDNIPQNPLEVRKAIIEVRRTKLPDVDEFGSAGSFFKNPIISKDQFDLISPDGLSPHYKLEDGMVKVPAAWLIDSCGLKGAEIGGAAVWTKQPLVLVNKTGQATAEDILALENKIITEVQNRFGITLFPEVEHI